jgi:hypothetical protein
VGAEQEIPRPRAASMMPAACQPLPTSRAVAGVTGIHKRDEIRELYDEPAVRFARLNLSSTWAGAWLSRAGRANTHPAPMPSEALRYEKRPWLIGLPKALAIAGTARIRPGDGSSDGCGTLTGLGQDSIADERQQHRAPCAPALLNSPHQPAHPALPAPHQTLQAAARWIARGRDGPTSGFAQVVSLRATLTGQRTNLAKTPQ